MPEQLPNPSVPRKPRDLDGIVADIIARIPHGLTNGSTARASRVGLTQPYIMKSRSPLEEMWDQTRSGSAEPINEPMAGSVLADRTQSALHLLDKGFEQNPAAVNKPVWLQATLVLRGVHELTQTYDPDDLLPTDERLSFEVLATILAQTMTAQDEIRDPTTRQALLEGVRLATEVFTAACMDAQFLE